MLVWMIAALALVFRPVYQRVETVFKVILAVLAASLVVVVSATVVSATVVSASVIATTWGAPRSRAAWRLTASATV